MPVTERTIELAARIRKAAKNPDLAVTVDLDGYGVKCAVHVEGREPMTYQTRRGASRRYVEGPFYDFIAEDVARALKEPGNG